MESFNPEYKTPKENWATTNLSPSSLCHHSRIIESILQKLDGAQLKEFEASCFGHLLVMKDMNVRCQLIHAILQRQIVSDIDDGLKLFIGDSITSFCEHDFSLVTGLKCGELPRLTEVASTPLKDKYFEKLKSITCSSLEDAFSKCDVEDNLKMALVLFVEGILNGRETFKPIDMRFLMLVENLHEFNNYPWGSFSWKLTVENLREVNVMQSRYSLRGFPLALQVWAYEVIPDLTKHNFCSKIENSQSYPRIITWKPSSGHVRMNQLADKIFEINKPVKVVSLIATNIEKQQPWWTFGELHTTVIGASKPKKARYSKSTVGEEVSSKKKETETVGEFELRSNVEYILKELSDMKKSFKTQFEILRKDTRIIMSRLHTKKTGLRNRRNLKRGRQERISRRRYSEGDKFVGKSTVGDEDETHVWEVSDNVDKDNSQPRPASPLSDATKNDCFNAYESVFYGNFGSDESKDHVFSKLDEEGRVEKPNNINVPLEENICHTDADATPKFVRSDCNDTEDCFNAARGYEVVVYNSFHSDGSKDNGFRKPDVEGGRVEKLNNINVPLEENIFHTDAEATPDFVRSDYMDTVDSMCKSLQKSIKLTEMLQKLGLFEDCKQYYALRNKLQSRLGKDYRDSNASIEKKVLSSYADTKSDSGKSDDRGMTDSICRPLGESAKPIEVLEKLGLVDDYKEYYTLRNKIKSQMEEAGRDPKAVIEKYVLSGEELSTFSETVINKDSGKNKSTEDDCDRLLLNEEPVDCHILEVSKGEGETEYEGEKVVLRRSCRSKRPGPHLVTPFRVMYPNKRRRVENYNPLKAAPKLFFDELNKLIEVWITAPCLEIDILDNRVNQQFILDIIEVGAWLSFLHIDIGLALLRKRRRDYPDVFGTNWTTADHSFSTFLISDYGKVKNLGDMSTWRPDTRLEKYVRGQRPLFSSPWDAVDTIYMPVIISKNHWLLVVVNLVGCSMMVYDPRVNLHAYCELMCHLQPLAVMFPHLLNKYGLGKKTTPTESLSPWPITFAENVPQQTTDDCGVYTIKFVDCLTAKFDLGNWSKYDIQSIRVRLAIEFIQGSAYL